MDSNGLTKNSTLNEQCSCSRGRSSDWPGHRREISSAHFLSCQTHFDRFAISNLNLQIRELWLSNLAFLIRNGKLCLQKVYKTIFTDIQWEISLVTKLWWATAGRNEANFWFPRGNFQISSFKFSRSKNHLEVLGWNLV